MPYLYHQGIRDTQPTFRVRPNMDAIAEYGICGGFLYGPWMIRTESFRLSGNVRFGYDNTFTVERPDLIYLANTLGRYGNIAGKHTTDSSSRSHFFYTGSPSARSMTFLSRFRLNQNISNVVVRSGVEGSTAADGNTIPIWRNSGAFDMRVNGTDYAAAGTFNLNQWYDHDVITSESSCVLQLDGVDLITGGAPTAGTIQGVMAFGGISSGNLDIEYILISRYTLSPAQRLSLHMNPWQLYEADPEFLYWPAGAPPGPSFDAKHSFWHAFT